MEIQWREVPEEIKTIINVMPEVRLFVPPWLLDLTFIYINGMDNAARSLVDHKSRWANIEIGPSFIEYSPEEREEIIVHELIHIFLAPLQEVVDRMLDGDSKSFQYKTYISGLEEAVNDLAFALSRGA